MGYKRAPRRTMVSTYVLEYSAMQLRGRHFSQIALSISGPEGVEKRFTAGPFNQLPLASKKRESLLFEGEEQKNHYEWKNLRSFTCFYFKDAQSETTLRAHFFHRDLPSLFCSRKKARLSLLNHCGHVWMARADVAHTYTPSTLPTLRKWAAFIITVRERKKISSRTPQLAWGAFPKYGWAVTT